MEVPILVGAVPRFSSPGEGSSCGRKGMPAEYAEKLYRDYLRLGSLSKLALLHGRTRQSVWDTLSRRGYALRPLKRICGPEVVMYAGLKYTPDKNGFLRTTRNRDRSAGPPYLHRRIWVEAHGQIPPRHEVVFINGDKLDCRLENLKLSKAGKRCAELNRNANQFTHSRQISRIEACMGWITKEAVRLAARFRGVQIESLIQEGRIGVVEADKRFDPKRGCKFLTYASFWIRQRQIRFCTNLRTAVSCPEAKFGTGAVSMISLNAPLTDDADGGEVGDLMGADEEVTRLCISEEQRALLIRAMKRLPLKTRSVLHQRFFEDKTLEEIGVGLGLSRERIRQIESIGLKKLHRSVLARRAVA